MRKLFIFFLIACVGLFLTACGRQQKLAGERIVDNILEVSEDGLTKIDTSKSLQAINNVLNGPLTEKEQENLLYLREEEKLARDLYLMLFENWGLKVFNNVAHSESSHTTAVKQLINKYKLEDPASPDRVGEFKNKDIVKLYGKFLKKGKKSKENALRIGGEMEEISLKDLNGFLASTDKPDLAFIYNNLMLASRNHLRIFSLSLEGIGYFYEPAHISKSEYKDIINAPVEREEPSEEKE